MSSPLARRFDQAILKKLAEKNFNRLEWREHRLTTKRFNKIRTTTERLAIEQHQTRINQEHRRLLRDRTSPQRHLKYPRWHGYDQLSPNALREQAERNVKNRHHARMRALDKREKEDVQQLIEQSERRQQKKGELKQNFNQSVDRRSGVDRRQPSLKRRRSK